MLETLAYGGVGEYGGKSNGANQYDSNKKVSVVLNHSSHAVVLGILFFCMLLFAAQWLSWTIRPALCAWLVWRGVLPAVLYGV